MRAKNRYSVIQPFLHTTASGKDAGVKGELLITSELIVIQCWDFEEMHTFMPLSHIPKDHPPGLSYKKAVVTKSVPDGQSQYQEVTVDKDDLWGLVMGWLNTGLIDHCIVRVVRPLIEKRYEFARDIAGAYQGS